MFSGGKVESDHCCLSEDGPKISVTLLSLYVSQHIGCQLKSEISKTKCLQSNSTERSLLFNHMIKHKIC